MYLVLLPQQDQPSLNMRGETDYSYKSYFTSDIGEVSEAIQKRKGTIVYKLDTLVQVKDVLVTHEEVTEETE